MSDTSPIWIIDDDPSMRWVLERALARAGMDATPFERGEDALRALAENTAGTLAPGAVVTDIRMPGLDGLTLVERLHQSRPGLPVVVMTAHSDLDTTVAAFESGAFDYLAKPFDLDDAVALVRRACSTPAPAAPEPPQANANGEDDIIGRAPPMQDLFRSIGRLARAPVTVLITGESGTGKERVARALHRHSPRSDQPFVAINTAAIPRELLESELFGHEKGAFTGADARHAGRFEQADGGTLFLDEIGDMPAELQTRLLRVLSEGAFHRVGGTVSIRTDVRILAATHQDLEQRVAQGDFRADLYHRLNVVRLPVAALRERRTDIPLLADHFLATSADELGMPRKHLTAAVEEQWSARDWPGNVRELENACRWLTVMAVSNEIRSEDLPAELSALASPAESDWQKALAQWTRSEIAAGRTDLVERARERVESILIRQALEQTGGHRQRAARLLGWGRNTLTRKIRELAIET